MTTSGRTVFTSADIRAGQDVFLRNGLMEFGSIFGHGAYLGPDFTADQLHRSAEMVLNTYGGAGSGGAGSGGAGSGGAGSGGAGSGGTVQRTHDDFKRNRFDRGSGVLTVSDAQADTYTG